MSVWLFRVGIELMRHSFLLISGVCVCVCARVCVCLSVHVTSVCVFVGICACVRLCACPAVLQKETLPHVLEIKTKQACWSIFLQRFPVRLVLSLVMCISSIPPLPLCGHRLVMDLISSKSDRQCF